MINEICNEDLIQKLRENKFNHWFLFDPLDYFTGKTDQIPWFIDYTNYHEMKEIKNRCEHFVKNNVAYVTIEAANDEVLHSKRDIRVTFTDQLGTIGGTLGLLSGMSIISFIEVLCFFQNLARRTVCERFVA